MKIGMIFECGPGGADQQVCEYAAKRLAPQITVSSVPLYNKKALLEECGKSASVLINKRGCKRVIIIWDLHPFWERGTPSASRDKARIKKALKSAGVPMNRISLVCIEHMLEAWLLADERALSATIPPKAHPARVRVKAPGGNPDKIQNPKRRLIEAFQRHSGKPYNDRLHAAQIAHAVPDCTRLRHSPSFRLFAKALTAAPLKTHC